MTIWSNRKPLLEGINLEQELEILPFDDSIKNLALTTVRMIINKALQKDVAIALNCSTATVTHLVNLFTLPDIIKSAVKKNNLVRPDTIYLGSLLVRDKSTKSATEEWLESFPQDSQITQAMLRAFKQQLKRTQRKQKPISSLKVAVNGREGFIIKPRKPKTRRPGAAWVRFPDGDVELVPVSELRITSIVF